MSRPITLGMAYYENDGMLRRHYDHIRALPPSIRDHVHLVIVDDGSPDAPAQPPTEPIGVPTQIYRIGIDVRWNQDAARNIAVRHSECEWVLLTDMDHMVPEETWRGLMARDHDHDKVYTFKRREMIPEAEGGGARSYKSHPNSWLMTRRTFDHVGGYDERYAGYYGSDGDFRNRLRESRGDHAGHELVELSEHLLLFPRSVQPDASTTRYLRKQPEDVEGKKRVAALRAKEVGKDGKPTWIPLRYQFPYELIWRTM